jgi:hypothetical protein
VTIPAGTTEAPLEIKVWPTNYAEFTLYTIYSGRRNWEPFGRGSSFVVHEPGLAAFEVPAQIRSGQAAIGKIKLDGLMPRTVCTNYWYALTSSNSSVVQVPSKVVVAPGSSESPFEIKAATVNANQTVTISLSRASSYGDSRPGPKASITVNP